MIEATRKSLAARGLDEAKIQEVLDCLPKPKVAKAKPEPIVLTAEEQRIRAEQRADDNRSEEFKRRLVPAYHKSQNAAGRGNMLARLRELKHIKECCQGLSRFEAPRTKTA